MVCWALPGQHNANAAEVIRGHISSVIIDTSSSHLGSNTAAVFGLCCVLLCLVDWVCLQQTAPFQNWRSRFHMFSAARSTVNVRRNCVTMSVVRVRSSVLSLITSQLPFGSALQCVCVTASMQVLQAAALQMVHADVMKHHSHFVRSMHDTPTPCL